MLDTLKIDNTDIFFENIKEGEGKLTISDTYHGAYTYYWGSMGSDLKGFIKKINSEYFAGKLCNIKDNFDAKQSVKSIRRAFRETFSHDMAWYEFPSAQKELRAKLRDLEDCENEYEFVDRVGSLAEKLDCDDLTYYEEKEFKAKLGDFFGTEPWHFIERKPSTEYEWLIKLHKQLKKKLK